MKVDIDRRKEKIPASENTVFMNEIVNEECLNEMKLGNRSKNELGERDSN